MDESTIARLAAINDRFYQITAGPFDASRQQPWPGWQRLLPHLPPGPLRVLDAGCGNGRLGVYLFQTLDRPIEYIGIDNNPALLDAARASLTGRSAQCITGDIMTDVLPEGPFDFIALMGVLHHIPGQVRRAHLVQSLSRHLSDHGLLVFTTWRFYEIERFRQRLLPWPDDLPREAHDYLLDWRRGSRAVRYCHYIDDQEEREICAASGLNTIGTFRSDGRTANANSYVLLRKA